MSSGPRKRSDASYVRTIPASLWSDLKTAGVLRPGPRSDDRLSGGGPASPPACLRAFILPRGVKSDRQPRNFIGGKPNADNVLCQISGPG